MTTAHKQEIEMIEMGIEWVAFGMMIACVVALIVISLSNWLDKKEKQKRSNPYYDSEKGYVLKTDTPDLMQEGKE